MHVLLALWDAGLRGPLCFVTNYAALASKWGVGSAARPAMTQLLPLSSANEPVR